VEQLGMRTGQATRRGYIVISPEWTRPHQASYEFSPREHDVVLRSLRDACRKFSINTDRVYLSGHSMGGDCAWDVALAHPDLWAGAIPIVATADKFITRYWENARQVPLYFVCGELDGDKLQKNAPEFDRYLTKAGFDCTMVEYLGRGHEHFIDEIQRLFDWCDLHERTFFPRTIKYTTMRVWDNYCYWMEFDELPPAALIAPASWPPPAGARPAVVDANVFPGNLVIRSGAKKMTVYLCPELINLEKPFTISFNGKKKPLNLQPSLETLLEDTRTRGDRQHPFWVKVAL
jgi:pimeloyl-ACP methyl ester carboxylesterase